MFHNLDRIFRRSPYMFVKFFFLIFLSFFLCLHTFYNFFFHNIADAIH